jgi:alpha-beta hydrolase superfamily lysophospholipase
MILSMNHFSVLTTPDGETLSIADARQTQGLTLRGQILLVHGLGEHRGRYGPVIQHLNDWGFAVRCYDHFGHGQSSGARGCLPSEDRLLDDLALMMDDTREHMAAQGNASVPLILLGHSMGGLVAAQFVAQGIRSVDAIVLSSPALATRLNWFERLLLTVLPTIAPNLAVANGLDANNISHDKAVVAAYLADPLVHNRISPRLGKYIAGGGAKVLAKATKWTVPTLLMYAGQDKLVDAAGSRLFTGLAPQSLVQSTCYEALYHEIFNEVNPSPVFEELRSWLDVRF